jgi:RHS repeat-associated protein
VGAGHSLASFTYGSGMIHSRTINTRGLPRRIRDYQGSAVRLDHTYSYDANGNLTRIDDPVLDPTYQVTGRESRVLEYDGRDRLIFADAMNKLGHQSFEYDALDNVRRWEIWRNDELGQYDQDYRYFYDSAGRLDRLDDPSGDMQWDYTVNGYGETTYRKAVYDYAGTSGRTWYYSWDAAGRMTAGGGEQYRYDAHGRRTRSSKSTGMRYQVYARAGQLVYSEDSSSGQNKRIDYISLNGRLVAERSRPMSGSTTSTAYLHTDQRGTPSVKTTINGYQIDRDIALPFGSPADANFREGPGFTGHQTDSGTMLIYMQQRYFDPVAQRFLSTDPVDVNSATGGNFNRYWYANNNPYTFVDSDGQQARRTSMVRPTYREQLMNVRAAMIQNEISQVAPGRPQIQFVGPPGGSHNEVSIRALNSELQSARAEMAMRSQTGVSTRLSSQKQDRHVEGNPSAQGKSYMRSTEDAAKVLEAFHSGAGTVLGTNRAGHIVFQYSGVTGYNNNPGAGFVNQPTNTFLIKGTASPSIVPTTPNPNPRTIDPL